MHAQTTSPGPRPAAIDHPAFTVGPDGEGHWVAVARAGLGGGLFRSREAATRYAEAETGRRPGAVRIVDGPVPLAF